VVKVVGVPWIFFFRNLPELKLPKTFFQVAKCCTKRTICCRRPAMGSIIQWRHLSLWEMDSEESTGEWCLLSGNHGNSCVVQMDITNQVPVLTESYLSQRICVNVQCQNEFYSGHFLNQSEWKDWEKNKAKKGKIKGRRWNEDERDGNLFRLLHDTYISWKWHYA
jgi:hypothetical protein